jgi:polyhydroxyalkanoate synthesis regulator phasin
MFETLDKLFLAGVGALSMTREKAEQIFEEYVEKGKLERAQKSGFVREMLDMAEKSRQDFERLVSEQVRRTIEGLPLATREDVRRIEQKLDMLLAQQKGC